MNSLVKRGNRQKLWPVYVSDKKNHEEPNTLNWFLLEKLKKKKDSHLIKDIIDISDEHSAPFTTVSTYQDSYLDYFETSYILRYGDTLLGSLSIGISEELASNLERVILLGRIQNFIQESLNPIKIEKKSDKSITSGNYSLRMNFGVEIEKANNELLVANVSMVISLEVWKIMLAA